MIRIKVLLGLGIFFNLLISSAQTPVFEENFETLPLGVTTAGSVLWSRTSHLSASGLWADSARIQVPGDSSQLITPSFSTLGNPFVRLEFDHICKLEFFDEGAIEVSADNGLTWIRLTGNEYLGNGYFSTTGNRFSAASYTDWDISNPSAIPAQSWWKHETFNISAVAGNVSQVRVRFVLRDLMVNGGAGHYGWLIDNIKVSASMYEVDKPQLSLANPILPDTIFNTGPFGVFASIQDASGIASAVLVVSSSTGYDTIPMNLMPNQTFQGIIPSLPSGTMVCYHLIATDGSPNHNTARLPEIGCVSLFIDKKLSETFVGNGNVATHLSPLFTDTIGGNNQFSNHLSIFTAQELNHLKGDIVRLAFKKANTTGYTFANGELKIYLKHTILTSVPTYAQAFANELATAAIVYQTQTLSLPMADGWVDFSFQDTFLYNGVDNLMLLVSWHHPDTATANFLQWENSQVAGKAATYTGSTSSPTLLIAENLRPNITLYTDPFIYSYDIGVHYIDNPLPVNIQSGVTGFSLGIRNHGFATLTHCKIWHTLDGILQPAYIWTGTLPSEIVSLPILIASHILAAGPHTVKIWTELPNDSADQNPLNDTLQLSFYHCSSALSGTYTFGGASSDFQSLGDLENRLYYCGLTGPTTILFTPGTYTGQLKIDGNTPGLSAINTLTLKSSTSKATDVILQNTAGSTGDDYILALDGAGWVTVQHITFEPRGTNFGKALVFVDGAHHNLIEHCRFNYPDGASQNSVALYVTGESNSYNTFRNNTVQNAYIGVYTMQNYNQPGVSNQITDNQFLQIINHGVRFTYEDSLRVSGNYIKSINNAVYFNAMSFNEIFTCLSVTKNRVEVSTASGYGMLFSSVYGLGHSVVNNAVTVTGSLSGTSTGGISLNNSGMIRFYHNAIRLEAGGTTASCVYINAYPNFMSSGMEFIGNIFANFASGFAFHAENNILSMNLIVASDYNCYFSTGSYLAQLGSQYINNGLGIGAISVVTQKDVHSLVTDPGFYASHNLHSFALALNGSAIPLVGVNEDMDGQPRSATTPDIGADEFNLSSMDAGIIALLDPLETDTQNRVVTMKAVLRNFGTSPLTSVAVSRVLNQDMPVTIPWSGLLAPGASDTITMGSFTVPSLDYRLRLYTYLTGDTLHGNDTLDIQLFGLPLVDLSVTSLKAPTDACNMGNTETVKIKVYNGGVGTAPSGFPVSYQIQGNSTVVTESIPFGIGPKDSLEFSFSAKANMAVTSQDSLFTFILGVHHPSDPRPVNDTLLAQVKSLSLLPAPVIQDTTIGYGDTVQLFAQSGFSTLWFADSVSSTPIGSGNYFSTPILFDTTRYYVESNSNIPAMNRYAGTDTTTNAAASPACVYEGDGNKHQLLVLATELQALGMVAGNITAISFYVQSTTYNTPHAQFTVKMGHTNATSLTTAFISSGLTTLYQSPFTEGTGWNLHTFATPFYWNGISNVVIETQTFTDYGNPRLRSTATPFTSVAYIPAMGAPGVSNLRPNIRLATAAVLGCTGHRKMVTVSVSKPQYDLQLKQITEPSGSCGLSNSVVTARIRNNGSDPMPGGYLLSYSINNGSFTAPEMVTQNLASGDSLDYTFLAPAAFPSGPNGTLHSLTARVQSANDAFTPNDTLNLPDIFSDYTPPAPQVFSPVNIPYGHSAALQALSTDSVYWFGDQSLYQPIGTGTLFLTVPVYDTTLFYASAIKTIPLSPFTLGTGTTTSNATTGPSPFGAPSYLGWGLKNQFLIRASELRNAGMMQGEIHSIAFNNLSPAAIGHSGYSIQIGTTQQQELNHYEPNLTQVYYNNQYQDITGWNTFSFTTPFSWDGESNLVIQTCFKNTAWVTSGYSSAYQTPTTYISALNSYSGSSFQCSDTLLKNLYYMRPNIRFTAQCYGSCKSPAASVQVNVSGIPPVDAGVINITDPNQNSLLAAGSSHSLKIVLKNFGTDTLTSVAIQTQIKGNIQPVYNWTGILPGNGVDTVLISSPLFTGGTTQIKAWTSMPNNQADTIHINDTSSITLQICMGGNYTIGPLGRDYASFNAAVADMLLNKVCSPVTFLADSGLYQEQIVIPRIPGADAVNTVLFRSSQSDSTKVTIQSGSTATTNYVIRFQNASYVTLQHLGVSATGGLYGNVIAFDDTSHHITLSHNRLVSTSTTGSGTLANCVYSNNKLVNHLYIENNHMENGLNSAWFTGEFSSRMKAIVLNNNVMQYFSSSGIYGNYLDSLVANGNIITSGSNQSTYYGVNLNNTINGYRISGNQIHLQPAGNGFGIYLSNTSGIAALHGIVDNNFVNLITGTGDQKGIYLLNNSSYVDVIFNTVKIATGTQNSFAYSSVNGTNQYVKNNIFHADAGYTIHITNPSVFSYCNYNNYSTDTTLNPNFGYWTNAVTNLQALKQADVTKNTFSVSIDPLFSSANDLHINQILLKGSGDPFAGILYDIDGDIRSTTHPDIGADEFFPSAYDISMAAILEPFSGCQLSAASAVKIRIRNLGVNTLNFSSQPVIVNVFITGPIPDTLVHTINSGSLASGQQQDVILAPTCNLSVPGIYTLTCHLTMSSDGNLNNNSGPPFPVKSAGSLVLPFNEGFESGSNIHFLTSNGISTATGVTPLASASGNYGLHLQGGSPNAYSYPPNASNAFSQASHVARVYSCNIDATSLTSLVLRFDLKQTFFQTGSPNSNMFRVMVTGPNGTDYLKDSNGDSVFVASTPNMDTFASRTFSLFPYLGQNFTISFEAFLYRSFGAGSFSGDNVFIDNINLWSPSVLDVSVREFTSFEPPVGKTGSQRQVSILIDNFSSSNTTQVPVAYRVNNGTIIRDTFNGSIAPLTFAAFTFAVPFSVLPGLQVIEAFTELPGDTVSINDTTILSFTGLNQYAINFSDNFEGADLWFATGSNNQWELGIPASTNFTTAHSGSHVWATDLTGNYLNNSTEYLYTPYFTIPLMPDTVELEFWQQMQVQASSGYGYLQYSSNGTQWTNLGFIAAPGSANWYNINISGTHVWSQNTSGWIRSSLKLDPTVFNTNQPFQVRFVFKANNSTTTFDGWMIDDFKVYLPVQPVDGGVVAFVNPSGSTQATSQVQVHVKFCNFGSDTLLVVPVGYRVNSQPVVTENWNGYLHPGDTADYTFSQTYTAPLLPYTLCAFTQLPTDLIHTNDTLCQQVATSPAAIDGGISLILSPSDSVPLLTDQQVFVRIMNFGANTLSNFPVSYSVNGLVKSTESYSGSILSGDSADFTFATTYQVVNGTSHTLCVKTVVPGDMIPQNDSACGQLTLYTGVEEFANLHFKLGQNIPNPADQYTRIPISSEMNISCRFKVTNLLGNVIHDEEIPVNTGTNSLLIDVSAWSPGIYLYSLEINGSVTVRKMVVY